MEKRSGAVTFAGGPVTLVGPEVKVGEKAPDFKLLDNSLAEKTLKDYEGKIKVISVVPSLDTGVCDAQTRWFNKDVTGLSSDVVVPRFPWICLLLRLVGAGLPGSRM